MKAICIYIEKMIIKIIKTHTNIILVAIYRQSIDAADNVTMTYVHISLNSVIYVSFTAMGWVRALKGTSINKWPGDREIHFYWGLVRFKSV